MNKKTVAAVMLSLFLLVGAGPIQVNNKVCPVSGATIGEGGMAPATYEYKGKVYNFCCAGCVEEFKKDPEKYIAIVDKESAQEKNATAVLVPAEK